MAVKDPIKGITRKFRKAELDTAGEIPVLTVDKDRILEVAQYLKENEDLYFDGLLCLTGMDYIDNFGVVYHLYSFEKRHSLVVKAVIPKDKPEILSVTSVWAVADWFEREAYDLFGIKFTGHPDLRRILCHEDFPGHPLRKDFPLENNEEYLLREVGGARPDAKY